MNMDYISLTKIFTKNKNDFYDDYAHHPTEINSILDSVKNVYKNRKIISVFEPHRYSRILSLKKEFAASFVKSDIVLLCPLYAAGEKKNTKFSILFIKFVKIRVFYFNNSRTVISSPGLVIPIILLGRSKYCISILFVFIRSPIISVNIHSIFGSSL